MVLDALCKPVFLGSPHPSPLSHPPLPAYLCKIASRVRLMIYRENPRKIQVWDRARIFNLLRTLGIEVSRIRCLVRNQFRCGIYSWRHLFHVKELKISELSLFYVVCGGRTPLMHGQHISNTPAIWYGMVWDEKFIPALKINIFRDMATTIPYLIPNQF